MKGYGLVVALLVLDILFRMCSMIWADARPAFSETLWGDECARVYFDAQLDELVVQVNRKPGPDVDRAGVKAKGSEREKDKHSQKGR